MQNDELSIIQEIIAEEMDLNPEDITEDSRLREDLQMEELSILQVLMACEVEFNVKYETADAGQMETVGDILNSLAEF